MIYTISYNIYDTIYHISRKMTTVYDLDCKVILCNSKTIGMLDVYLRIEKHYHLI